MPSRAEQEIVDTSASKVDTSASKVDTFGTKKEGSIFKEVSSTDMLVNISVEESRRKLPKAVLEVLYSLKLRFVKAKMDEVINTPVFPFPGRRFSLNAR